MRTTLLGSLLDAAQGNLARDAEHVALFESGRVYLPRDAEGDNGPLAGDFAGERAAPFAEPHRLGCLAVGPLAPKSWRGGGEPADFFALKGVLGGPRGAAWGRRSRFEPAAEPFLHPGRAARVLVGETDAGWIGEVHPLVCREWDLEAAVGFEVAPAGAGRGRLGGRGDLRGRDDLPGRAARTSRWSCRATSRPRGCARRCSPAAASCCAGADVFDLYEGEQLGEGRKSLALRLEFRAARPHPHRRGGRRAARVDRGRAETRSGGRSVSERARVLVGRSLRLHRRARRADRLAPSAPGAGRRHLAQRRRHAGWTGSTRATGCRWS